jgi:hypothetical protein
MLHLAASIFCKDKSFYEYNNDSGYICVFLISHFYTRFAKSSMR